MSIEDDMIFMKETTSTFHSNICHTYMVSRDKSQLFGYIPSGTNKVVRFNKPKQFVARDRTFTVTY